MAPKKKTTVAVGPSEAGHPVPTRASSGPVAERTRGAIREHQHRPSSRSLGGGNVRAPGNGPHAAKSKDGARPSTGGAGPSKIAATPPEGDARASRTPTPAPTTHSSQAARDERRNHAEDPGRCRGKSRERHSRDVEDLPARRGAGEDGMRPRGRDRAPSDMVTSRSASQSVQVSLPPTPAEALARAQLLLDFPPTIGKLDKWRAPIRSLVAVANKDDPTPTEPPGRRSDGVPRTSGRKAGGAATTMHSPPPRPVPRTPARRNVAGDEISVASSEPRTRQD